MFCVVMVMGLWCVGMMCVMFEMLKDVVGNRLSLFLGSDMMGWCVICVMMSAASAARRTRRRRAKRVEFLCEFLCEVCVGV